MFSLISDFPIINFFFNFWRCKNEEKVSYHSFFFFTEAVEQPNQPNQIMFLHFDLGGEEEMNKF